LRKYGDTDVFPHLPELAFFRDETAAITDELKNLDLDSYNPGGAIEALAPKGRYSFRITHQLSALDTVLLLAAAVEIGPLIEGQRTPSNGIEAFSYRFDNKEPESLFQASHTYRDWLVIQQKRVQGNLKFKQIVVTDISDFYARINFHRLENLLDEAAPGHGAARYIKKTIKVIRGKQSFGLPVGGTAARILAELALVDTDKALIHQGLVATRFVDDFRFFLSAGESPYDVLSFIAKQLSINEGLSLNASKTAIFTRAQFLSRLKSSIGDVEDEAKGKALEALTNDIYFDEAVEPADIEALKALNLLGFLQDEIGKEHYDVGRIKVIFRALRIAKPAEAIDYLKSNLSELIVFAKEITLLMQGLAKDDPGCFDDISGELVKVILKPPATSVQLIRTWLMELFVRGVVQLAAAQLKRVETLQTILDKRQTHLIRGRIGDKNFFRMNKANMGQLSAYERSAFVLGAACLPKDEFEKWLGTLKPVFSEPTGHIFLKWLQANKGKIFVKLSDTAEDHPE